MGAHAVPKPDWNALAERIATRRDEIDDLMSLLRDHDSNTWLGTTRGLLRINGKGISFSQQVNSIGSNQDGRELVRGLLGVSFRLDFLQLSRFLRSSFQDV